MEVRRYDPERDADDLRAWCEGWGVGAEIVDVHPQLGFIVPGLAVVFLYRTDSPLAMVDGLVSNPASDPDERGKAVDLIMGELFEVARALGFRLAFVYTAVQAGLDRATHLGFQFTEEQYRFGVKPL